MRMVIDRLFSRRNPKKEEIDVSSIIPETTVEKIFTLILNYNITFGLPMLERALKENPRDFFTFPEFIARLNLVMDTNGKIKHLNSHDNNLLLEYLKSTKLNKFFDAIELFIKVLIKGCNIAGGDYTPVDGFIEDFNNFFKMNDLPYKIIEIDNESFIIKITTKHTEESLIEPLLTYTDDAEFREANRHFAEALKKFARGNYPDTLKYSNSTIEAILLKILNKGSGHIDDLYKEFEKKYLIPRAYKNNMNLLLNLIEQIQTIRSQEGDLHAKNKEKFTENVEESMEEVTELALNQTASFGVYLIKLYKKFKK